MAAMAKLSPSARRLAGLLAGAGVAHFAAPKLFDATVPTALPGSARTWTYVSGVAEFALAAAIVYPGTRRRGGLAAAAFFAGVFPANVKMAMDWKDKPAPLRNAAYARLPLQIPLVWWAWQVSKERGADHSG